MKNEKERLIGLNPEKGRNLINGQAGWMNS